MADLNDLRITYCQANRCWRSNNLKSCIQLCKSLALKLNQLDLRDESIRNRELMSLMHLVWLLKTKCLAEEYYVNESFLLNEDDIDSEDQVRTYNATSTTTRQTNARPATSKPGTSRGFGGPMSRHKMSNESRIDTRGPLKTAMLTGKMPTRTTSRQSGRATSSYRPLTTSLTASQTAFSRSTRPLLKYSTCRYLSKPIYEYLYNAQSVTNVCADYRQCLEYLNLVRSSRKIYSSGGQSRQTARKQQQELVKLSSGDSDSSELKCLGAYWSTAAGICYFHLKMHKQAEDLFRACVSIDSKYLDPYLWLIKVYIRFNQPIRVLKTCDEASANSCNAIIYNWKARVQSLINEPLAAHVSLRASLQFYPTNIEALANVGYYSFYEDKFELALKCFERVNHLAMNIGSASENGTASNCPVAPNSSAELFNNLALCNLQCGNYARAMPLFQRAFLNSPNKEVTSNIWFNISFVPMAFGARSLAIACLRLALKNDSQNEDAINNLGVLKYDSLINDALHYRNVQEYWSVMSPSRSSMTNETDLVNCVDQRRIQAQFDDVETYFGAKRAGNARRVQGNEEEFAEDANLHPEMLFNMALVKRRRGQMLASLRYCDLYLQYDQNNHTIGGIMNEIRQLVSHDS